MQSMSVPAQAKVNLGLAVLHLRSDGYHEILSVLHQIDLADRLTLRRTGGTAPLRVRCSAPDVPEDERNLVWKAGAALWRRLEGWLPRVTGPVPWPGAEVLIEKRIPAGAGLGGGSADAAAALKGLVRLWDLDVPTGVLARAAGEAGADVPFFLEGGTSLAAGTGTRLRRLNPPRGFSLPLVVVAPPRRLHTADVYARFQEGRDPPELGPMPELLRGVWEGNRTRIAKNLHNHLEGAARSLYPELTALKEALLAAGLRGAAVTGSGSAVYGVAEGQAQAAAAARELASRLPECDVLTAQSAPSRRSDPK